MKLIEKLFGSNNNGNSYENNSNFDAEEYIKYNNEKIDEFKNKYDLYSVDGILSIPISEARKYPDGGRSVVYMPEQILNRQATEYKKAGKYDLAIACLKKANELYPYSFYAYTRDNYERLVDMMILAKKYNEAKEEHNRLNELYGTREDELVNLQKIASERDWESTDSYQKRVIDPYIQESKDRECYYWILENIPNIAPKSFGAYRRMKKLNTSTYIKIENEVRNTGNDINDLKFWN